MAADPGKRPAVPRADVFEVLPTPYVVLDRELHVLDMNAEYLAVTGRRREDLVGAYFLAAFPPPPHTVGPDGRSELQVSLEKVRDTGRRDTLPVQKYPIAGADGVMVERHWLAVHVPVLDASGRVVAVVQRTEDVTEFSLERDRVEALALADEDGGVRWRLEAERVQADLFVRARELADALAAKDVAAQRTAAQAEVALALVAATTMAQVEDIVVGRGLSVLGCDGGGIVTPDEDGGWRITVNDALGEHVQTTYPSAPWDSMIPGCWAARTGERLLLPDRAAGLAYDAEVMTGIYDTTGRQAWALLPMAVGEHRLGSLAAAWTGEHRFAADELDLLDAFAAQCAQALLRIRTAAEQEAAAQEVRALAQSLQQALLTPPPQPDGLRIAVRYRPAGHHAQVGGDWYDALQDAAGQTVLVIGDVVGHDSVAAAKMGQMRGVLRTLAYDADPVRDHSPAEILTRLEHAALGLTIDTMASVVLARVEPHAEPTHAGRRLRWSNAGHPPPLLLHRDGSVTPLDTKPDVLVGVTTDADRHDHVSDLPPGSTLFFYTDGLVERRDVTQEIGLSALQAVLAPLAGVDLDTLCDAVLTHLAPESGEDDIALLAVRVDDVPAVGLPFGPAAPGLARAFVGGHAGDVPAAVASEAALLVSELVSNAVLHGAPDLSLTVRVQDRSLVVTVHDGGDGRPASPHRPGDAATSGRGLLITETLADRWGVTPDPDGGGKTVWFALDLP